MDELGTILLYVTGVNIATFIIMGVDKQKSKRKQWRIPERTFWGLALIGGAFGAMIGMKYFRHKTKHRSFTIGMPILLIIHIVLLTTYFSMS